MHALVPRPQHVHTSDVLFAQINQMLVVGRDAVEQAKTKVGRNVAKPLLRIDAAGRTRVAVCAVHGQEATNHCGGRDRNRDRTPSGAAHLIVNVTCLWRAA